MGGAGYIAVAAMLAGQAAAEPDQSCQITYSAGPPITEVLRERGFAFQSYDELCAALRQHGLELTITGSKGVETDRAYGWASLTARRPATGALSTREHLATYLDEAATEVAATDALYSALNTAADMMFGQLDVHLQSIGTEEEELRASYRAQSAREPR